MKKFGMTLVWSLLFLVAVAQTRVCFVFAQQAEAGSPPPTCSLNFSPSSGHAGTTVTYSWSSKNDADGILPYQCTGSFDSGTLSPANGSGSVNWPNDSQSCALTVENSVGQIGECSAEFTVLQTRTDLFRNDRQIIAGLETEIGSVTIETNGGVVALWGSSTVHLPADTNIKVLIRIRKDGLTGPVLGVGYLALGIVLPENLSMTVTAIGTDINPAAKQTYKLTAENHQGGENLFGNLFRRLVAINLQ